MNQNSDTSFVEENTLRYLTKSKLRLAMECPTKLYYVGKSQYANQKSEDSFLEALAEGGFQVAELARCSYPDGKLVESLDYDEAIKKTSQT